MGGAHVLSSDKVDTVLPVSSPFASDFCHPCQILVLLPQLELE